MFLNFEIFFLILLSLIIHFVKMAKQQTFADKVKKKTRTEVGYNVKVIKGYRTEQGNLRFFYKFVRVNDLNELANVDISK